jgi:hypothetical protein
MLAKQVEHVRIAEDAVPLMARCARSIIRSEVEAGMASRNPDREQQNQSSRD